MRRAGLLGAVLLSFAAATAFAGPGQYWLHVRVHENDPGGESVRVNVPVSMVEKILPLIDSRQFRHGRVQIDNREMTPEKLRDIWAAVKDAGEGEFVTVDGPKENVRVARAGAYMLVKVDEADGDKVDIKVPLTVVDALLKGEGDELDVLEAVRALSAHGPTELISVTGDDADVRIWVDALQAGNGRAE